MWSLCLYCFITTLLYMFCKDFKFNQPYWDFYRSLLSVINHIESVLYAFMGSQWYKFTNCIVFNAYILVFDAYIMHTWSLCTFFGTSKQIKSTISVKILNKFWFSNRLGNLRIDRPQLTLLVNPGEAGSSKTKER